jgi:hypothetical protein
VPEGSLSALAPILSALRGLRVWLLAGLALSGWAVLFLPPFAGIDPQPFRHDWGVWVWIEAIVFSILAVARGADAAISACIAYRKAKLGSPSLRLVPRLTQCWWHLAKQKDGRFTSQLSLAVHATNLTDLPVRFVKARLIRPKPKGQVFNGEVMLPKKDSPYHSQEHAVPPHDSLIASVHLIVSGAVGKRAKPLHAIIGITDQFGHEYRLKRVVLTSHDPVMPRPPLGAQIKLAFNQLFQKSEQEKFDALPLPAEWKHGGKYETVDLILSEETRCYAANNRERGGLGSLNITLQSMPNGGWTEAGNVPQLLWPKGQGKTVTSDNLGRLLSYHAALSPPDRTELERYLTSHLHRKSAFSSVGYFSFLALHRMGRTAPAIIAARATLSGDNDYAYSNLLGVLSGLVSHEHEAMQESLLADIGKAVEGDKEHNFKLAEKLTLARLQHIDAKKTP